MTPDRATPAPTTASLAAAADREKRAVALGSVVGAVVLTGLKVVVGVATGSLGILSEALHSALDLVAAVITLLAVRASGRPADTRHTYGHGKIENLSALFETFLLLVTCVWIVVEAVERLFFKHVEVDPSLWAFGVMAVSIAVDWTRSRALLRAAKKHDSQALEADALHFSTDIWSSSVVIVGLAAVLVAERTGLAWLRRADALAALAVAGIVVWVSIRLGRRTIADLLDEVSAGAQDQVRAALRLPGVVEVGRVRLRRSGPEAFADVTLRVAPGTTLERGHAIADAAEAAVRALRPGADVVVHVEPASAPAALPGDLLPPLVREAAARAGIAVHDIHAHDVLGSRSVELHLEVSESDTVATAHERATAFERDLRGRVPGLARIVTHLEPTPPGAPAQLSAAEVLRALRDLSLDHAGRWLPHDVVVRQSEAGPVVSLHCTLDADLAITAAHELTERMEQGLRERLPGVARVVIHVEPPEAGPPDRPAANL